MKEKDRHARNKIDKEHEIWKKHNKRRNQQNNNQQEQWLWRFIYYFFLWTETQNNKNKRYDLTLEPKLWYQLMWTRNVKTHEQDESGTQESQYDQKEKP